MAMTVIWTGMTAISLVCALALGNGSLLASAALEGAANAIQLGLNMAGVLCLWMGVMEVMQRAGLAEKLARVLRPVLRTAPGQAIAEMEEESYVGRTQARGMPCKPVSGGAPAGGADLGQCVCHHP